MDKVRVFVSYSRKDRDFLNRVLTHLAPMQSEGLIAPWTDLAIEPGDHWDEQIAAELDRANIILLLITADFLASRYIRSVEVMRALEREKRGEVVVIPVILNFANWDTSPFHYLQALPANARPVTDWRNRDEAYLDIALGVRKVIARLRGDAQPQALETVKPTEGRPEPEPAMQDRVLDAAMAARIPLAKPSDLAVMVRRVDSPGLKAIVGLDDEYTSQPEDVKSKPFQMEFHRDAHGRLKMERLTVKIESPDFDPPEQEDDVFVPPERDSDVTTFLLRPLYPGELVIKLKVFAQDGRNVVRLMRIVSEASDRAIVGGRVVVSIPIGVAAGGTRAATANQGEPTIASPPPAGQVTSPYKGPQLVHAPYASPVQMPVPTASAPPPDPPLQAAPAKKRTWVMPAMGAIAATVLIGTVSLTYLGRRGASPRMDVTVALNAPPAPPISASAQGSVSRTSPSPGRAAPAPTPAWEQAYTKGVAHAAGTGDYATALPSFQQAAQGAPNEPAPLIAVATANLKLAEKAPAADRQPYLAAAVENANRAAQLQPDSAETRYLQGLALERNGQFADAESALRKASALKPEDGAVWYALGLALEKQNKTDDAIDALNRAVQLAPSDTDARLLLTATLAQRHAPEARAHLEILKQDSSLPPEKRKAVVDLEKTLAQ